MTLQSCHHLRQRSRPLYPYTSHWTRAITGRGEVTLDKVSLISWGRLSAALAEALYPWGWCKLRVVSSTVYSLPIAARWESLKFSNLNQQTEKVASEENLKGARKQALWIFGERAFRRREQQEQRPWGHRAPRPRVFEEQGDRAQRQRAGSQTVWAILLDFELTWFSEGLSVEREGRIRDEAKMWAWGSGITELLFIEMSEIPRGKSTVWGMLISPRRLWMSPGRDAWGEGRGRREWA